MALIASAFTANAQKDVTSQYITNATLSSLTGWTNVNFNTPVKGNNTTGYASEAYAGWGSLTLTNFSLTQTITLPAGHYTLVNYSFYRYGESYNTDATKSLAYLKAGSNEVAIKTLGSITATGYANSQAEGANCFDSKMYRNTLDFTIDSDDTAIEIGVYGTHELMRSWMILGMFELINNDIEATIDSPFDVTGYITNPGFEYRDLTGWTLSENGAFVTQSNSQSFKVGGYYAEKWQPSTDGALSARSMSQTISGLPAGFYQLTVNLGGSGTYVTMNGKTANWTADGDYSVGCVIETGDDLTITLGKDADGTANWIHFDNVRLKFGGDIIASLSALCDKVTDYDGNMPTAMYTTLKNNIDAYDPDQGFSSTDVDDYINAIAAVQALYDEADPVKELYTELIGSFRESLIPYRNATTENINGAQTTFTSAIASVMNYTAPMNATSLADLQQIKDDAIDALTTFVLTDQPTGTSSFDMTFLLTNPDLTGLPTWTGADGWYSEYGTGEGNSQVMTNDDVANGTKNAFYEFWSWTAKADDKFTLYQQITLPEGTYTMNCYAFAKQQDGEASNPTVQGVYFYANDTQGDVVADATLTQKSISFVNSTEQNVKIGLKAVSSGNSFNWMGIGYVELYKVPAQTYTIDETAAYDNTQSGAGDVTLKRTIKAGYNTLVLPFSMTQTEVEDLFGTGSKVYVASEYTAATECIHFTGREGISANQPCILEATEASSGDYILEARTVVAGEPAYTGTDVTSTGSYAASLTVPTTGSDYILNSGNIYLVDSAVTIAGTRAYFTISGGSGVKELNTSFDGIETSINSIDAAPVQDGKIYNLAGQRVSKAQKGIYVINGKKVVVK